jgi:hypothetical protein
LAPLTPVFSQTGTQAGRQGGQAREAQGEDAQAPQEEDSRQHISTEEVDKKTKEQLTSVLGHSSSRR